MSRSNPQDAESKAVADASASEPTGGSQDEVSSEADSRLKRTGIQMRWPWRKQKVDLEKLLRTFEALQAESRSEIEALREQKSEIAAEHAARIEDIAVLMQQNEVQLRNLQRSHQQELEAIRRKQAETQAEVETLREEKAAMQVRYDEMIKEFHESTSWKVTKPLRGLKTTLVR